MSVAKRLAEWGDPFPRRVSRADRVAALLRRPLDRRALRGLAPLPSVERLGRAVAEASSDGEGAPRVLVAALRGWPNHCTLETTIAQALRVRGAEVALLTCGGGQPACEMGWAREAYPRPCDRCAWYTEQVTQASGLRSYRLADRFAWGSDGRRAPARAEHATIDPRWASEVSVPWFLKLTDTDASPDAPQAWADYAVSSAAVEQSASSVLAEFEPDIVFLLNGLFASERVIREMALTSGARVITYEMGPRENTLFFSADAPACDYDTTDIWAGVHDRPLTEPQRDAIQTMLSDRVAGTGAHESYFDSAVDDAHELRRVLGLRPGRRVLSLFTNIGWDSAALGHDIAFPSMIEWIVATARMAGQLEDVELVVRIHPAEERWGTNEDVEAAVRTKLGEVPPNVHIVPASQALSSYGLLGITDLALVYTTTVGLEAANLGVPVAVAGRTHYRGRGFTQDIDSPEQQAELMGAPAAPLTEAQRDLALRYAFTFFFRALVPFDIVDQAAGGVVAAPETEAAIAPGADPYLDLVCQRILEGGVFSVPDELIELP